MIMLNTDEIQKMKSATNESSLSERVRAWETKVYVLCGQLIEARRVATDAMVSAETCLHTIEKMHNDDLEQAKKAATDTVEHLSKLFGTAEEAQ